MILDFEKYIQTQKISNESKKLYQEGVICYKASAYRAAYLMTYLGFMESIKTKIMFSEIPEGYTEERWRTDVIHKIQSEEVWDTKVFEILIRSKDPIFEFSEGIKTQLYYWKDRRNDCAHFKRNEISYSHIEAFWLFIKSNFEKLNVNSNVEYLIDKFRIHFDLSKTRHGEPYEELVNQCIRILDEKTYENFFNRLFEWFTEDFFFSEENNIIFSFISENDSKLNEFLITYLKQYKKEFVFNLLKEHPKLLLVFSLNKEEIRNLWFEKLFVSYPKNKDLNLFCSILRNGLLPNLEKEEAFEKLLTKFNGCSPTEEDFLILKQHGYFNYFKITVFEGWLLSDFDWGNKNISSVVFYLEKFDLDSIIVSKISSTFNQNSYFPFKLKDGIKNYFETNELKRNQFKEIAKENEYKLPDEIFTLSD